MVQIEENVRAYARHLPLRMATVFGGVSERPQIEALRSGVDLVVATPGRLIDLMGQRVCNFSGIEFLVLDEADRMLDMGFLPPIRQIVKALPRKRQTLMFSASLSREIEKLTHEFQQSPKIVEIGRRANPADTVTQLAYEVRSHLEARASCFICWPIRNSTRSSSLLARNTAPTASRAGSRAAESRRERSIRTARRISGSAL